MAGFERRLDIVAAFADHYTEIASDRSIKQEVLEIEIATEGVCG